jgi:hypothetical protein
MDTVIGQWLFTVSIALRGEADARDPGADHICPGRLQLPDLPGGLRRLRDPDAPDEE